MGEWEPVASRAEFMSVPRPYSPQTAQPLGYHNPVQDHPRYAGFWLRFVAYVIDFVITMIGSAMVGAILGFAIAVGLSSVGLRQPSPVVTNVIGSLAGAIVSWLYCTLLESSRLQATVGKMAVGIIVTNEVGERIGFGRANGRHFAKILSGFIIYIGFMMAGWTERKQALHDMVAGTLVVRK